MPYHPENNYKIFLYFCVLVMFSQVNYYIWSKARKLVNSHLMTEMHKSLQADPGWWVVAKCDWQNIYQENVPIKQLSNKARFPSTQ